MPALESKATILAAIPRAVSWVDTNQANLDTARANLRATLRAAWIAGTAPSQATLDTQADAVNRLAAQVAAGNAILSELNNQQFLA